MILKITLNFMTERDFPNLQFPPMYGVNFCQDTEHSQCKENYNSKMLYVKVTQISISFLFHCSFKVYIMNSVPIFLLLCNLLVFIILSPIAIFF